MQLDHLLAVSDHNLIETSREWTRRVVGGVVHEEIGVLLFLNGEAPSSGVIRTGAQRPPSAESPLARAMVTVTAGVGSVDWVATRAPYRGRGLGEAVTRVVSNAGFDLGARLIALHTGGQPETLYRRVEYIPVTRFRWWGTMGLG